jgi:phosphoenolpyruvate carboxykinase (ATP)
VRFIENAVIPGVGGHPKNVVFLTCDVFGVLPPIAKLDGPQAQYHFLSGYTSKVAGTERGLGADPQATFSTCFGAPFLLLHPTAYSTLLAEKVAKHRADCWLVNTGWTGGAYGVGKRIDLPQTRAIVRAALEGKLQEVPFRRDPVFGFRVPSDCPGASKALLDPRGTWKDPGAYDARAKELAALFKKNFAQFTDVPAAVKAAGPAA